MATYDSGWTFQDFLKANAHQTNDGGLAWMLPDGSWTTDPAVWLQRGTIGGQPAGQYAQTLFGTSDPASSQAIPDALPGSLMPTGPDAAGMMLALGGVAGAIAPAIMGAGAAGAAGAAEAAPAAWGVNASQVAGDAFLPGTAATGIGDAYLPGILAPGAQVAGDAFLPGAMAGTSDLALTGPGLGGATVAPVVMPQTPPTPPNSSDKGGGGGGLTTKDLISGAGTLATVGGIAQSVGAASDAAHRAQADADRVAADTAAREERVRGNRDKVKDAFSGFDDDYYGRIAQSFKDYYTPRTAEAFDQASRQTLFAAPGGVGSTSFARNLGNLERDRGRAITDIGNQAFAESQNRRADVEGSRNALLSQAESSEDPGTFGDMATTAAQAAAREPVYSPIADLFNRYSSLAASAALANRAGYKAPQMPLLFRGGGSGFGSSGGGSVRNVGG